MTPAVLKTQLARPLDVRSKGILLIIPIQARAESLGGTEMPSALKRLRSNGLIRPYAIPCLQRPRRVVLYR